MAKTTVRVILGTKLRELREQRSLTQLDVARHLDVRQTTVSSWERDQSAPTTGQLNALAVLFEVPVHDLVLLAADYEARFKDGRTNKRADSRPNHHRRNQAQK